MCDYLRCQMASCRKQFSNLERLVEADLMPPYSVIMRGELSFF